MRRLGVYLTYDKQSIVDEYIGYMLKELKNCVECLVVVCNELSVIYGIKNLDRFADRIFYRDNIGLDAGGFKDALTKFLGWNKVLSYDELVLVNDSLFGPFCPIKDIFEEMDKRPVDFWGLCGHGESRAEELDYFPEHIQSFFITIRRKMLHSSQFRNYWESMPYYSSYNQVVREHEMRFTSYFSDLGYTYDIFSDIKANDSLNPANNYCQFSTIPYELIKKRNFPFLKKQQLAGEKLTGQTQEELFRAICYIDQDTDYNIDLIWKNIIRTLNMTDLQRNLHLQYIVDEEEKNINLGSRMLLIVYISYEGSADYVLDYLNGIDCHIEIIVSDSSLLADYRDTRLHCQLILKENIPEFLAGFCEYDLVCILNDVDLTSEKRPNYIGKSEFFNIWNNLVRDKNYLSGIQALFEKNRYLGLLTHPKPNFGDFFGELGKGWNNNYQKVCRIIKAKALNCQVSEDKPPFAAPRNLWIRGNILKKLSNWEIEELELLPYAWIYLVQDSGYYSGIVESSEYSSMNEVNLQYYLDQITELVRFQYGGFDNLIELKKMISEFSLNDFCRKCNRILVYGTGVLARKYRTLLPKLEAYIVSDGQSKIEELDGIPVKYLSEIDKTDDCGIVLCLNKKNQIQVVEQLKRRGIKNYFCI